MVLLFSVLLVATAGADSLSSFMDRSSTKTVYWRSQGELSDPATGKVICQVHGIEASLKNASTDKVSIARRYLYVQEGAPLKKWGRRQVKQPPPYTSVMTAKLGEDGRTVTAVAEVGGRSVAPSRATLTGDKDHRRLDTYVSPDGGSGPQRAPLVGLSARAAASPSLNRAQKGLRCRESYTEISPDCATYSRFGECPAWVGPGKLCALDLTMTKMKRLPKSSDLPELENDRVYEDLLVRGTSPLVEGERSLAGVVKDSAVATGSAASHFVVSSAQTSTRLFQSAMHSASNTKSHLDDYFEDHFGEEKRANFAVQMRKTNDRIAKSSRAAVDKAKKMVDQFFWPQV